MKTLRCCTADLSDEKTEITTFWKLNPTSVRVIDLTPLPHFPIDRFERRRGEGEDRRNEGGRRGVCKMFMMVLILLYIPQLAESNSTGKVTIPSITGINVLCHLINTHDTSPIVLIIFPLHRPTRTPYSSQSDFVPSYPPNFNTEGPSRRYCEKRWKCWDGGREGGVGEM